MSYPTCSSNHDSRRVFMMRWYYFPAVTFFLCTVSILQNSKAIAEPTQSGSIRGAQSPQQSSVFLDVQRGDGARQQQKQQKQQQRQRQLEGGNPCPSGTSNCTERTATTMSSGCDKATKMPDDGTKIIMNITNAPLLGPQCYSTYKGKGYWFEIQGKGRYVAISTCHQETSLPTVISVYQSSNGGCGKQLSCLALKTTTTSVCFPLRFLAENDVTYKISVLGGNTTTTVLPLAEPKQEQDEIIALSITREVTCPCWSAAELLSTTPTTNDYLAQSCNTIIINKDDELDDASLFNDAAVNRTTSTSIFILDSTLQQGAQISRIGGLFNNHSSSSSSHRIECSIHGSLIRRSIPDLSLDDEVQLCLGLLHDRCAELSKEGAVWSMFQEACTPDDFRETILRLPDNEDIDEVNMDDEYMDCLRVGTDVPTAMPSRKPVDHPPHNQS